VKRFRKRVRIQTYVEPEVAQRIGQRVQTMAVTESGLLRSSILEFLDRTSDTTLTLRRLDRLGRSVERLHRDVEFLSEAFAVFVRTWFAHTQPLPVEREAAARASAEGRNRQFMELVVQQFTRGARFLDDLPKEQLVNDAELDAVLATADLTERRKKP
jgi:hypothetical protein